MAAPPILVILALIMATGGCSYLNNAVRQERLAALFDQAPAQRVYKHMLTAENFFVFGKIKNGHPEGDANAVVAISDLYQPDEVVDVGHFSHPSSIYGLNLPAGEYQLLVVNDRNRDGLYEKKEVVGGRHVRLDPASMPDKVLANFDIDLDEPFAVPPALSLQLPVRKTAVLARSLFFPAGSIRGLDDEVFSRRMATLGMYEPAAFLEEAPMMFYALEENLGYKVPVVFVHGIGGSARDFAALVAALDRGRYCPWFFFYPSGADLEQLGEMFYTIFLSGRTIPLGDMPMVVVAHSMGGLVVREAMNRLTGARKENHVARFITIASPFGGHPAAAKSGQASVAIPSWRDIDPASSFIRNLFRRKLPDGLEFHLFYAYGNEDMVKLGENSDGVVPLSSQLCRAAQDESTVQSGFNDTHTGVLHNREVISRVAGVIGTVRAPYPEDHMAEFQKGGYDVPLGDGYDPWQKYSIMYFGRWLDALASGRIAPMDASNRHFVEVVRGQASPNTAVEEGWQRFVREYPERDRFHDNGQTPREEMGCGTAP